MTEQDIDHYQYDVLREKVKQRMNEGWKIVCIIPETFVSGPSTPFTNIAAGCKTEVTAYLVVFERVP